MACPSGLQPPRRCTAVGTGRGSRSCPEFQSIRQGDRIFDGFWIFSYQRRFRVAFDSVWGHESIRGLRNWHLAFGLRRLQPFSLLFLGLCMHGGRILFSCATRINAALIAYSRRARAPESDLAMQHRGFRLSYGETLLCFLVGLLVGFRAVENACSLDGRALESCRSGRMLRSLLVMPFLG